MWTRGDGERKCNRDKCMGREGHVEVCPVQNCEAEAGFFNVVGAPEIAAAPEHCPMQRLYEVAGRGREGRCGEVDGLR